MLMGGGRIPMPRRSCPQNPTRITPAGWFVAKAQAGVATYNGGVMRVCVVIVVEKSFFNIGYTSLVL